VNQINCNDKNPSPFDMRCSAACTRAGLTAILFAAIAIAVLQPLENATARKALRGFIS